MRRSVVFMAVLFVSVWICSTILSADFHVIPAGKKNAAPVGKTGQTSCHAADGSRVDCAASCMTTHAWLVSLYSGIPGTGPKTGVRYGACVRGGR